MAKYVLKYSELVEMEVNQLEFEFEKLESWLHETKIDEYFDKEEHIYYDYQTGDRWIFLPELTPAQLFTLELILSSSEVVRDDRPLRRGPAVTIPDKEDDLL